MSAAAQSHESDLQLPSQSLEATDPADGELPARYNRECAVPCVILSQFSPDSKQALKKVHEKAKEWFGEGGSREDSGRIFDRSMTLFLTSAQVTEIKELVRGTGLEVYTVKDVSDSIERGVRCEAPFIDSKTFGGDTTTEQCGINAGHAMGELSAHKDLPWEKQRSLTFDIWKVMVLLQNVGISILQNVQSNISSDLIAQAEAASHLSEDADIFEIGTAGIYAEAKRLTDEYAHTSLNLKELQEALLPLARALLELPSPIVKEVVYSQIETNSHMLGRALGLYESDPQPMLDTLDNWKAFWDSQVPLLSRYFTETAAERAAQNVAMKARTETKGEGNSESWKEAPPSGWDCSIRSQGDKAAVSPTKWDETVFHEIRGEHMWGMALMGVPGLIGDRAHQIISDVITSANSEAVRCRPAYGQLLVERHIDMAHYPDEESIPDEFRESFERQRRIAIENELKKAGRLVHGVTDIMLSNLPWRLPRKDAPLLSDPVLHLERTLTLLERSLSEDPTGSGLACTAKVVSQELAIQLNNWVHVSVLDDKPELAERCKQLFHAAGVQLPDDWCSELRERGILPLAG
jgi:hypothetical protein